MKNTIRQIFRSPKFVVGFCIMMAMLLTVIIYPILIPDNPLAIIGQGTFFKPGTYVSTYDSLGTEQTYTFKLEDAAEKRINSKLSREDRGEMAAWLMLKGVPEDRIDIEDTGGLLALWREQYDPDLRMEGMTAAKRKYYVRLDAKLTNLLNTENLTVTQQDGETGEVVQISEVAGTDYVNIGDVANVVHLPLGTDNFGRNVLTELVSATGTSLLIGVIAGVLATLIGLVLGLVAGYVGGWVDDVILFLSNILTVIPPFVLLILISFSIGQEQRGVATVSLVIGLTSWVWTARAVRAQVMSLRNRDHVNLSKISGHSFLRIIFTDILPYIASYVVMALILQISTAILAETQMSMLGLGPKSTETPTLGLMMYWAMAYTAHLNGSWWAYAPVILMITLISFSLNLMNTGLDQVFNPTLRD
ncbi:MAG TPA: ABC transporter permease [Feifaniaceae bacterium]|nr:ABC transporter permease [Feifaniaceae bacterium]